MHPLYRVPASQQPMKAWYVTFLWIIGTLIGVIMLSIASRFLYRSMVQIDMLLYPGVTSTLELLDKQDLRSVIPGIVNFGLIGLFLGSLQLPAAQKLKFKYWPLISAGSWAVGGLVFATLNVIMDSFMPYELSSGNWLTASIAGAAVALIQVKSLRLARDEQLVWGISILVAVLFRQLISAPILGWIPLLVVSSFAVHYLAAEALEGSN